MVDPEIMATQLDKPLLKMSDATSNQEHSLVPLVVDKKNHEQIHRRSLTLQIDQWQNGKQERRKPFVGRQRTMPLSVVDLVQYRFTLGLPMGMTTLTKQHLLHLLRSATVNQIKLESITHRALVTSKFQ
jgi:hypothetical protein